MLPEWLLASLVDSSYFCTKLTDAMASSLPDSMVIGLRLAYVEVGYLVSVLAHHQFAFLPEDVFPGIVAVHSDSFSHVVPVQAHPWD